MTPEKQIGFYDDQRHRKMNDSRERLGMLKDAYKPWSDLMESAMD